MTSFHKSVSTAKKDQEEKKNTAVAKLEQFLLERRGARQPVDDLEEFERELHSLFATAEAEVVGHEVNRFDIDLPFVTVDGIVHQRVLLFIGLFREVLITVLHDAERVISQIEGSRVL